MVAPLFPGPTVESSHGNSLVAVHRHPLRVPAQLAVSGGADGPAAGAASMGTALLEGEQLLGTEGLVVGLRGRLNKILQVSAEQEVSQIDEFAVGLVLDVDDTPPVLSALAMTGTTLTTSESFLRTTISIGLSEWPEGWMKKRQQ
jgi:hypothetical protein